LLITIQNKDYLIMTASQMRLRAD